MYAQAALLVSFSTRSFVVRRGPEKDFVTINPYCDNTLEGWGGGGIFQYLCPQTNPGEQARC